MARVKALLRRSRGERAPEEVSDSFPFGPWEVRAAEARACREDVSVDLTPREISILPLFRREAGRIVSRRLLLHEVWGFENPDKIETRTVDMQIGKLRRKLDGDSPTIIETVRGAGYRYTAG